MTKLKNRQAVIEQYANEAMEEMDLKDMCLFTRDTIEENISAWSDGEISELLTDTHPHILEDNA